MNFDAGNKIIPGTLVKYVDKPGHWRGRLYSSRVGLVLNILEPTPMVNAIIVGQEVTYVDVLWNNSKVYRTPLNEIVLFAWDAPN